MALILGVYLGAVTTTLQDARVASALDRMYTESAEQMARLRERSGDFDRLATASAQERADAFSDFYLPVTPEAGRLLYALVRASRPSTVRPRSPGRSCAAPNTMMLSRTSVITARPRRFAMYRPIVLALRGRPEISLRPPGPFL